MIKNMFKRTFDILLSILLLALFSPVLLVIAVLIKLSIGSPVIFSQERPGRDEKIFKIRKFRSMKDAFNSNGDPLPDDQRVTQFGRFLRAMSLDELPELWNILIGEMSFVGPRPLLVKYLPLYSSEQQKRHAVRPGLTGWAQINGRNALSWKQKFELDVWYVENMNFFLDLKIMFLTAWKVIKREGISQAGFVSSEEFDGEN